MGENMVETNAEKRRENRKIRAERKKRLHRILAMLCGGVAVLTAVIVVAALLSGDSYKDEKSFQSYAASYFEEESTTKDVGRMKTVVKYGTPLSTGILQAGRMS